MDMRVLQHIKEKWIDPMQAREDLILRALQNHLLAAPALAEGTNPATIKTTNTVAYVNQLLLKSKAATDNIAIPAGVVIPVSSFCKFLVSFDSAGTITVTQGNIAPTAAGALLGACPVNNTPFGYFQIATNGATTYTPGTTDNGAAGITQTYVDSVWPDTGSQSLVAGLGTLPKP